MRQPFFHRDDVLATNRQADRIVERHFFLLPPQVDDSPEPVVAARFATVFHDQLCQIGNFIGIHS